MSTAACFFNWEHLYGLHLHFPKAILSAGSCAPATDVCYMPNFCHIQAELRHIPLTGKIIHMATKNSRESCSLLSLRNCGQFNRQCARKLLVVVTHIQPTNP